MTRGGQRRWIPGAASSNTFNNCEIFTTVHIFFKIMEHYSHRHHIFRSWGSRNGLSSVGLPYEHW